MAPSTRPVAPRPRPRPGPTPRPRPGPPQSRTGWVGTRVGDVTWPVDTALVTVIREGRVPVPGKDDTRPGASAPGSGELSRVP